MDPTAIAAAPVVPFPDTVFFRACTPHRLRHYEASAFDGAWTGIQGGRYNSPRSEPTLYLAGCQTVATFEVEQMALMLHVAPPVSPPLVVVATEVLGARLVDLTDGLVRQQLDLTLDDLMIPTLVWKQLNRQKQLTRAQRVADALRSRDDVDGLLVPSWFARALPGAEQWPTSRTRNLVLFMEPSASSTPRGATEIRPQDPDGVLP